MSTAATPSPAEEYRQRRHARQSLAAHYEKTHIRLGNLRLLIAIAAAVLAWWSFYLDKLSAWWLLAPAALFAGIAVYHAHILHKRDRAQRAANHYAKGVARIEDRWAGNGQQAPRANTADHVYAADLDLFGPSSLFELLSQARTHMGEDTLARWLLAPSPIADLRQRHAAIDELRPRLGLREDIAVLEGHPHKDIKTGVHPAALLAWAEAPAQLVHPNIRWLARLLALAAIATAILWIESGTKTPFFSVLIIEAAIAALLHKRTTEVLHAAAHAFEDLNLLSALVARIERESFTTPRLQSIRKSLFSNQLPASKAIARLATIAGYIDSLESPIVRFLDIPLLYSIQTAYAAEAWRRAHGSAVRRWIEAIGEAEALLSLSAYSYEHPADLFPDLIEDGPPFFNAKDLGHPLLPAAKCIRNSIVIGDQDGDTSRAKALLISGSNMSGKSTLLRAIGINTVLAMAGAPVRAASMKLTALHVGASILINDSLQQGSSRFYAEITRLRRIADLAEKSPPLLFLLDELLQGTNSKDRLTGAEGVVRALLDAGAIGLISTHDLALTNIGGTQDHRLHNVHFQDEIEDGHMKFDYKLRPGIVTHSNGIELMRLIGLKV